MFIERTGGLFIGPLGFGSENEQQIIGLVNNSVNFQSHPAISVVRIEDSSLNILSAYTTSPAHNS